MRHRREIDFKNFSQLPLRLEHCELASLLCEPPSEHGLQAQYRIKEIQYWENRKNLALAALEEAQQPICTIALDAAAASASSVTALSNEPEASMAASTAHAQLVEMYRTRIAQAHQKLDGAYAEFIKADEKLVRARHALQSVYDSKELSFVAEENVRQIAQHLREIQSLEGEAAVDLDATDESGNAALMLKLEEEARKCSIPELIARMIRNPVTGLTQTERCRHIIHLITKSQAVVRKVICRRRYISLKRSRRTFDRLCIQYQFYFFRKFVQASRMHRKKLLNGGFRTLQGFTNLAQLKRGVFAVHVTRAKIVAMIQRIFLLWRNLTAYHLAPIVNNVRVVTFEKYLPEWDDCLKLESFEEKLMILARVTGCVTGAADTIYNLVFFWRAWRRYLVKQKRMHLFFLVAVRHDTKNNLRKHFYAWMDIISFTAQREATILSKKMLYFGVWRRLIDRIKRERRNASALIPIKKLQILNTWRKRVVDLRLKRAVSNVVILGNRPLLHFVVSCWLGDAVQQAFIGAWRRWRVMMRRRNLFRQYVGCRWHRRVLYLKRTTFAAWQTFHTEGLHKDDHDLNRQTSSPQKNSRAIFIGGATPDAMEDWLALQAKDKIITIQYALLQTERQLAELGPPPSVGVSKEVATTSKTNPTRIITTLEHYTFNPADILTSECSYGPTFEALQAERATSDSMYNDWWVAHSVGKKSSRDSQTVGHDIAPASSRPDSASSSEPQEAGFKDRQLLITLIHLALQNKRKQQSLGSASKQAAAAIEENATTGGAAAHEGASPASASHTTASPKFLRDLSITMCVGYPFHQLQHNEMQISQLESFFTEDSNTNYIISHRKCKRDARINRKTHMRIAALRLFDKCSYFLPAPIESRSVGFSPYQYLLQQYIAKRDGEKPKKSKEKGSKGGGQSNKKLGKFYIPLPPVPKKHQLPFLVRLHMKQLVDTDVARQRMACHKYTRVRLQRAVLLMSLATRTGGEIGQKRMTLTSSVISAEEKGFRVDVLLKKMQHSSEPFKDLSTSRGIFNVTLDLLGFNPKFLKGAMQQRTKRLGRLRALMKSAGEVRTQWAPPTELLHRVASAIEMRGLLARCAVATAVAERNVTRPARSTSATNLRRPRLMEVVMDRRPPTPPPMSAPLVCLAEPEPESEPEIADEESESEQEEPKAPTPQEEDSAPAFESPNDLPPVVTVSSDDEEMAAELGAGRNTRKGKTLIERHEQTRERAGKSVFDMAKKEDFASLVASKGVEETAKKDDDDEEIVFQDEPAAGVGDGNIDAMAAAALGSDSVARDRQDEEARHGDGEADRRDDDDTIAFTDMALTIKQGDRSMTSPSGFSAGEGGVGVVGGGAASPDNEAASLRKRIPRLWGNDDKNYVPSIERLLEISSRFGAYLNQESRSQLDQLKLHILKLLPDQPTAAATEAMQAADAKIASHVASLSSSRASPKSAPPTTATVTASPTKPPQPKAAALTAPASAPPTTTHSAPPALVASPARPMSSSVLTTIPSAQQFYRPPRVFRGVDEAQMLLVDSEAHRIDLFCGGQKLADNRMQSTANLMNDITDHTAALRNAASVSPHPLQAEVMRKHPRRAMTPSTVIADQRSGIGLAGKLRHTVQQQATAPIDDFSTWLTEMKHRMQIKATFATALEELVLEEALMQRKLVQSASIPVSALRESLQRTLTENLSRVQLLKAVGPPQAATSDLLDAAVEKISFSPGVMKQQFSQQRAPSASTGGGGMMQHHRNDVAQRAAVEPLTDVEVSRLVSMLASSAAKPK